MANLIRFLPAFAFVSALSAADVSGAWKTSYTNTEGQKRESTLTLKVDGGKLAGTIASVRGNVPIAGGTVDGNHISFTVIRKGNGDEIKIAFDGTVEGDQMKLEMRIGDRPPIPMTA